MNPYKMLRMGLAGASMLGGKFATRNAKAASQQQLDTSLGLLQSGYGGIQSNLTNAQNYVTGMIPQMANPMYTGGFYAPQAYMGGTPGQAYPSVPATQGIPTGAGGVTDLRYGPQGNANDVGGSKGMGMAPPPAAPNLRDPGSIEFNPLMPRGMRDKIRGKVSAKNDAKQAAYDEQMAAYNADQAAASAAASAPVMSPEQAPPIPNYGQDVVDALKARQTQAIADLEARRTNVFNELEGIGTQGRKDINEAYGNALTQNNQGMVDSGLYGSTVNATLNTGINRERAGSLSRLNENIGQMRAGYESALSGDIANVRAATSADQINAMDQQRREYMAIQQGIPAGYIDTMNQYAGLRNSNISNFTANAANMVSGVNIGYPDQNQIIGSLANMGNASGLAQYRKYLESQQSIFGGMGGSMFGGLGAGVGALLAAPTGGMSVLGGALIGGGLGYGGGTALDRPW